eukprot:6492686-Amphidinium_carterae.3
MNSPVTRTVISHTIKRTVLLSRKGCSSLVAKTLTPNTLEGTGNPHQVWFPSADAVDTSDTVSADKLEQQGAPHSPNLHNRCTVQEVPVHYQSDGTRYMPPPVSGMAPHRGPWPSPSCGNSGSTIPHMVWADHPVPWSSSCWLRSCAQKRASHPVDGVEQYPFVGKSNGAVQHVSTAVGRQPVVQAILPLALRRLPVWSLHPNVDAWGLFPPNMEGHLWPYWTMKVFHRRTLPFLPVAKVGSEFEFKGLLPSDVIPYVHVQHNVKDKGHAENLIGTPDETVESEASVFQTTPFNQKGRTLWALADDHHGQILSQWRLDPQREYNASRDSHNAGSTVVPVHPGSPERNNDPGTHSFHKQRRARNRVSRLAGLPGWAFDSHSSAGFQAYSW